MSRFNCVWRTVRFDELYSKVFYLRGSFHDFQKPLISTPADAHVQFRICQHQLGHFEPGTRTGYLVHEEIFIFEMSSSHSVQVLKRATVQSVVAWIYLSGLRICWAWNHQVILPPAGVLLLLTSFAEPAAERPKQGAALPCYQLPRLAWVTQQKVLFSQKSQKFAF